ncbi:transcriptional regulator NrdR [Pelagibacterium montanilacus]|uniref:transcriptional regulator NrdR n=1 Tax=Pelagibacterium montanilacus TaxID=2185280 RepID=UPI000F8C8452|nr:transcriptional regulator NrdR [Pelagibacterium montanilacus]
MRCPYCGNDETQVKDSRPTEDSNAIRRRRICIGCGGRFTTFERVQLRDLTVVKKSGRKVPFDREKLSRSVTTALRKRQVDPEVAERMISGVVRQLESLGDVEVTSEQIGEYVMDGLKELDDVAFVRFASVYKNFSSADDFQSFLTDLVEAETAAERDPEGEA